MTSSLQTHMGGQKGPQLEVVEYIDVYITYQGPISTRIFCIYKKIF